MGIFTSSNLIKMMPRVMLRSSFAWDILDIPVNTNHHHKVSFFHLEKLCLEMYSKIHSLKRPIIITHMSWTGRKLCWKIENGCSIPRIHIKKLGVVVCACNHSAGEVKTCWPTIFTGNPGWPNYQVPSQWQTLAEKTMCVAPWGKLLEMISDQDMHTSIDR